jgi:hypothetical protein
MNPRIILIQVLCLVFAGISISAQTTRKVLFIGNSYTGVNNLPQMIKDAALSAGDTLLFDSNTPGGYTLEDHSMDPTTQTKIMAGGWHYVVLQGQSQEPIVQTSDFYGGGYNLFTQVKQYNLCAVPMLYITWGRKNGDASNCPLFPVMCTYAGMDSTVRNNYLTLADNLNAEVSPVSVVWNYLRQNHPGIELYQADESHPSLAGSYAAACCFYAAIFKKDPTLIGYNPGLNPADAAAIKNAAKMIVFDQLNDWDYQQLPQAGFDYTLGAGINEIILYPVNGGIYQSYFWDFGDGDTSTSINPTHTYLVDGTYTLTLTTTLCNLQGIHTSTFDTVIQFCSHTPVITTAHAWLCEYDTLWTQAADAYQWYSGATPLPVTTQYLADYQQYPGSNISVVSTLGGCSEESASFSDSPVWSGYYFDASFWLDPCNGDTAYMVVLNINGLSGTEIIRWFKNDTLLGFANDADTLFITAEGNYFCTVINPATNCPWDTTLSSIVNFSCDVLGLAETEPELSWNLYPNPATETITLEWAHPKGSREVEIYNSMGNWVTTLVVNSSTPINIANWVPGFYFIRFRNQHQPALKLIKQ